MTIVNGSIIRMLEDEWCSFTDSLGVENVIRSSEVESFKQESLNGDVTIIRTKSGATHRVKGRFGTDEKTQEDDSEQMPQIDMGVEYIFAVTRKPEMNHLHLPLDSWLFNAGGERNGFLWMTQHPVKSVDEDSWYVWRSERKITGDIGNPGANDSNIGKGRWSHPSMITSYNARGAQ